MVLGSTWSGFSGGLGNTPQVPKPRQNRHFLRTSTLSASTFSAKLATAEHACASQILSPPVRHATGAYLE